MKIKNNQTTQINLEKLELAIQYVERMSEGKHPITGQEIIGDSVVNDPKVIRCLFFIQEVLELVQNNHGMIMPSRTKKAEEFPFATLKDFQYRKDNSITYIMNQINEPIAGTAVKKISFVRVTRWLKENGYLEEVMDKELKKIVTVPTEKGKEIGIYTERREQPGRPAYVTVMYGAEAQKFIVENLEEMITGKSSEL